MVEERKRKFPLAKMTAMIVLMLHVDVDVDGPKTALLYQEKRERRVIAVGPIIGIDSTVDRPARMCRQYFTYCSGFLIWHKIADLPRVGRKKCGDILFSIKRIVLLPITCIYYIILQ